LLGEKTEESKVDFLRWGGLSQVIRSLNGVGKMGDLKEGGGREEVGRRECKSKVERPWGGGTNVCHCFASGWGKGHKEG